MRQGLALVTIAGGISLFHITLNTNTSWVKDLVLELLKELRTENVYQDDCVYIIDPKTFKPLGKDCPGRVFVPEVPPGLSNGGELSVASNGGDLYAK